MFGGLSRELRHMGRTAAAGGNSLPVMGGFMARPFATARKGTSDASESSGSKSTTAASSSSKPSRSRTKKSAEDTDQSDVSDYDTGEHSEVSASTWEIDPSEDPRDNVQEAASKPPRPRARKGTSRSAKSLEEHPGDAVPKFNESMMNQRRHQGQLATPSMLTNLSPRSLFNMDWPNWMTHSPMNFSSPFDSLFSDRFSPPLLWHNSPVSRMLRGDFDFDPGLSVEEHENEMVVSVKCPGIPKEKLKVRLNDDVLTIRGQHVDETGDKESGKNYSRTVHTLEKSIRLPMERLDEEGIQSHLEHGVLKITLPKAEEESEEHHGREIQID